MESEWNLDELQDDLHKQGYVTADEHGGKHTVHITKQGRLAIYLLTYLDPIYSLDCIGELIKKLIKDGGGQFGEGGKLDED